MGRSKGDQDKGKNNADDEDDPGEHTEDATGAESGKDKGKKGGETPETITLTKAELDKMVNDAVETRLGRERRKIEREQQQNRVQAVNWYRQNT